jgi:hypothetical protein
MNKGAQKKYASYLLCTPRNLDQNKKNSNERERSKKMRTSNMHTPDSRCDPVPSGVSAARKRRMRQKRQQCNGAGPSFNVTLSDSSDTEPSPEPAQLSPQPAQPSPKPPQYLFECHSQDGNHIDCANRKPMEGAPFGRPVAGQWPALGGEKKLPYPHTPFSSDFSPRQPYPHTPSFSGKAGRTIPYPPPEKTEPSQ